MVRFSRLVPYNILRLLAALPLTSAESTIHDGLEIHSSNS